MPLPALSATWHSNCTGPGVYRSGFLSLLVHGLLVAVLVSLSPAPREVARRARSLVRDVITLYRPPASSKAHQGGGGGGQRSPLPASLGRLPKAAPRQFTPPAAVVENANPKLIFAPSIVVPSDVALPQVAAMQYGDRS